MWVTIIIKILRGIHFSVNNFIYEINVHNYLQPFHTGYMPYLIIIPLPVLALLERETRSMRS
uniref:Uncharacterized protein n=1 Tax=Anguilla anguilla TaxID=7936 RepID=A0A0E9R688_ANGAN